MFLECKLHSLTSQLCRHSPISFLLTVNGRKTGNNPSWHQLRTLLRGQSLEMLLWGTLIIVAGGNFVPQPAQAKASSRSCLWTLRWGTASIYMPSAVRGTFPRLLISLLCIPGCRAKSILSGSHNQAVSRRVVLSSSSYQGANGPSEGTGGAPGLWWELANPAARLPVQDSTDWASEKASHTHWWVFSPLFLHEKKKLQFCLVLLLPSGWQDPVPAFLCPEE